MKIKEIRDFLDSRFPTSLSEEWDNDGDMLYLNPESELTGVVTTLDVTDEAIERAIALGANLIVSHHPLIFRPIKRLDSSALSQKIAKMIKNGISVLSYHTRLDSAEGGINDVLAEKIGLINPVGFGPQGENPMGRIGDYPESSPAEFSAEVSLALNTDVIFYEGNRTIKRVALLGGAGKDFIHTAYQLGADAMITGDVSYSVAMEELPYGITIVDAGHYATEVCAVDILADAIESTFELRVDRHRGKSPSSFITQQ